MSTPLSILALGSSTVELRRPRWAPLSICSATTRWAEFERRCPTRRGPGALSSGVETLDADPAHLLLVGVDGNFVVGTMQLSLIPGLSRRGALRAQIDAVRVHESYRSQGLGTAMFQWAIAEARRRGCALVQLTTDKTRGDAHRFYDRPGRRSPAGGGSVRARGGDLGCGLYFFVGGRSSGCGRVVVMGPDYELVMESPPVGDYVRLRQQAGLSPKTEEQATAALHGGWAACHVVYRSGRVVGMGRLVGDGGWYFRVTDLAVLPDHQRRGLGDAILSALLEYVWEQAPVGAHVNLLADPSGRRLYERHGFSQTSPGSVVMALRLDEAR